MRMARVRVIIRNPQEVAMQKGTLPPRTVGTDDASYYRTRALQEHVAALEAASVTARDLHEQLAMMYRFRSSMLSNGPRLPTVCRSTEEDSRRLTLTSRV
jgi:hypothetical protein